jgi:hypothetical protein
VYHPRPSWGRRGNGPAISSPRFGAGLRRGSRDRLGHARLGHGVTELVSLGPGGVQGNGFSAIPAISADGRFIAFYSFANTLVPRDTNGGTADVFVRILAP